MRTRLAARLACAAFLASALAVPAAVAHSAAVPGGLASPRLAPGESFAMVFDGPGTYAVHCHLHPDMVARLVVLPDMDAAGAQLHRVDIVDFAFVDQAGGTLTTVHTGDKVTWVNVGNATHDVHLMPDGAGAASADSGVFEASVLGGLAVALLGILWMSRRA
jgi:plastocyanin